jgi:hypothetical protein
MFSILLQEPTDSHDARGAGKPRVFVERNN